MSDDHARRMNGKVRGISLSGKAGATLDRIRQAEQDKAKQEAKPCSTST